MLIKYAGPPRALLAVLHGQKADSPKRHRRRDVGPLTESATLRHWPPPEADATAIATDWAIRPEVCYPALSRREASRLHRVPDGHPDEQLRPPGIRMPPPPAYRPNGVPMTAQRRALMSRAAANISRRQFMRRRAFGPRRGGLGEYGGYIAQNKAQAMLGGRFTGAPHIVTPNLFVARKSVPQRAGTLA